MVKISKVHSCVQSTKYKVHNIKYKKYILKYTLHPWNNSHYSSKSNVLTYLCKELYSNEDDVDIIV